MSEHNLNGINVKFPYDPPYDVQIKFMENVIDSLTNRRHAILESPTGTGKTYCLLCPTLAYVSQLKDKQSDWISSLVSGVDFDNEDLNDDTNGNNIQDQLETTSQLHDNVSELCNVSMPITSIPKIIYASRTHTQVSQAMQELKRTAYKDIKAAVIGSREQLCKNPELDKLNNDQKTTKCRILRKNDECRYYMNLQAGLHEPEFQNRILDIEDLFNVHHKFQCCSYYASKQLVKKAEIIFMPYNYLLDAKIRKYNNVDLRNAIIILDEAHNVTQTCEDCASFTIKSSEITAALNEIKYIKKHMDKSILIENGIDITCDDLDKATSTFERLYHEMENIQIPIKLKTKDKIGDWNVRSVSFIFPLLAGVGIAAESLQWFTGLLEKLCKYLRDKSTQDPSCTDGKGLAKLEELLQTIFSSSVEKIEQNFRILIRTIPDGKKLAGSKEWKFLCLSPAFGISSLFEEEIHCLIMASGTLSPLQPLATEMEIPNPILLSNDHIIKGSQVFVRIVNRREDDEYFNSKRDNRGNKKYLRSLGDSVVDICKTVPDGDGVLVFFQSYPFMDACTDFWQKCDIWSNIQQNKPICMEKKDKQAFESEKKLYYESINIKKGAVFFAVLRGKVSEGVDFADMYGRAVIIIGIPFLPKSTEVEQKQQYLNDAQKINNQMVSGDDWYVQGAIRAVNQAIGRVIRHINDYGAILFLDQRFCEGNNQKYLSHWVKKELPSTNQTFNRILQQLNHFYNESKKMPQPKPKLDVENPNDDEEVPSVKVVCEQYYPPIESDTEGENDDNNTAIEEPIDDQHMNSSDSQDLKRMSVNQPDEPAQTLANQTMPSLDSSLDCRAWSAELPIKRMKSNTNQN